MSDTENTTTGTEEESTEEVITGCNFCKTFDFSTVKLTLAGTAEESPKLEIGEGYGIEHQMLYCPYCGIELSKRIPPTEGEYTLYSYYIGLTRSLAIVPTVDFERMKIGDKMKIGTFDMHDRDEEGNLTSDELTKEKIDEQIVTLLDSYQTPAEE